MSSDFRGAAVRFAWSAWGEIGVPSAERRTFDIAIDLEALIHVTGVVVDQDARLRSQAASWQRSFPEFVSRARLKRLGDKLEMAVPGKDRSSTMAGQPEAALSGASAVQLRMRSALGVSARAEIVRQLVLDVPGTRRSSSDLAQLCGYTKRTAEKALESLERGGWMSRIEGGAVLRWSLTDHEALADLFLPLPISNASFLALAEIVEALVELDGYASASSRVRSAAARGVLAEVRPIADWGSVRLPKFPPDQDAWEFLLAWVTELPGSAL